MTINLDEFIHREGIGPEEASKAYASKAGIPTLGIESIAREQASTTELRGIYPVLNPIFLRMQHPKKYTAKCNPVVLRPGEITCELQLPRFAVYSLDSPSCSIILKIWYSPHDRPKYRISSCEFDPVLPACLKEPLKQAIVFLDGQYSNPGREYQCIKVKFGSVFNKLIPADIKERIMQTKPIFGKEMYIIAEAESWNEERIDTNDSLLIGARDKICFLIDKFD